MLHRTLLAFLVFAGVSRPYARADEPDLPPGFADTTVATGLTGATAMAVAPDGRLFVCEQTGTLRVIKDDRLLPVPFLTVVVDSYWERGLIGVTLDPAFPRKPFVYVCYVADKPYPHHRVSRFTARGDGAVPGSEVILLRGDDQRKLGGGIPAGHQGGALHFGKDGKLYVAIGEQTAGAPSQRLDTFQGKLLRLNPDGSIPEDNPFFKSAKGKYRAIWARGLRNPFAFAVQPGTGRIFINDVGNSRLEEINEGAAGANYGWPESEGPTGNPNHRNPVHAYDRNVGRSITGGTFYDPPVRQFPRTYVGKYFFLDFMDNWVRVLDPDRPSSVSVFATGLAGPVDIATAPDGSLYYLNRNMWVKDEHFRPGTGSVHRIVYAARSGKPLPQITAQPADAYAAPGHAAMFRLTASGGPPLRYQWLRNGQPIPGANGPRYTLPSVTVAHDGTEFRCRVSSPHGTTKSVRARLRVLPLRESSAPGSLLPGLTYRSFVGDWPTLPDLASQKPARSGTTATVDLSVRPRDDHFALAFEGYLRIDAEGVYSFTLAASGLARLFVAGADVAATAGKGSGREATGHVALRAGKHPFRLLFHHGEGRPDLRLSWAGPGFGPKLIAEKTFLRPKKIFQGDDDSASRRTGSRTTGSRPYGLPRRESVTTLNVPANPDDLPTRLSQTGVFRSLADLKPNPGILPYDVNSPLWSDGAHKRRWVALPGDTRVGFAARGEWKFPAGTVFIKHFEIATDRAQPRKRRRLETRLLYVDRDGTGYGATYKWRAGGRDADLLRDGLTETIPTHGDDGPRKWSYPSRSDCLVCHTRAAGFVLGVKTRQLNGPLTYPVTGITDNQLRTWNHLGLFEPALAETDLARYDRLASLTDTGATPELRVRSYLDSNCAQCHRPGGTLGLFDARFDTPLARQNLVNGPLAAADLGVPDARLIAPGDPARSMVYQRMNRRRDVFNMPPLASHEVDRAAVKVLAEWIADLARPKRPPPRR